MTGNSNPIWDYFRRNEATATCIVCMKELSLGSSLPKNQTVSCIKKHLEKVHTHVYASFRKLEEEYVRTKIQNVDVKRRAKRKRLKELKEAKDGPKVRKRPGRKRKVVKYSESEDMDHSSMTNIEIIVHDPLIMNEQETPMDIIMEPKNEQQDTSFSVLEHKKLAARPSDIALSRRIDRAILDLMIVDLLPFSIVEGEAFKRLNLADPYRPSKYVPKPAEYYKNSMLPDTYEAVKQKVIASLEQAEWISLSTTSWSDHSKSCCMQAVTGHFLYENQRHTLVLQISSNALTTNSINFIDITRKFNIVEKIHVNVAKESDSKTSEWFNCLECSAELMEKIITDAFLTGDSIEILKRKCHSIVDHFVSNPQAVVNLHECQELSGMPQQKINADVNDNWTSTYLMWDSLYENKSALELYIQQYGDLQVPSTYEWQKIEHSVMLLKIFHQAWLDLNSEAASASVIIPLLTMINAKLEPKLNDSHELAYLKQSVKSVLNENFAFVHQSSFLIIATLLDPRFKMRYLTNNQVSSCHAEMTYNLRISLNLQEADCVAPSFYTLPTNNYKFHNTSDLWEEHDTSTLNENNTNESIFLAFEQQLSFYLKEPLIARNGNIYQYWNITPYEYLRKLAYKYLTAPPTTLACSETIANVGALYAERRLVAKDDGIEDEKLLFMACNIKLFNFEY